MPPHGAVAVTQAPQGQPMVPSIGYNGGPLAEQIQWEITVVVDDTFSKVSHLRVGFVHGEFAFFVKAVTAILFLGDLGTNSLVHFTRFLVVAVQIIDISSRSIYIATMH